MTPQSLPSIQKTLVQNIYAQPLELKEVSVLPAILGTAVVKIVTTPVISYAKEVINGTRQYPYPTPFTPGPMAIGRVAALGPDSTALKEGQLVYVDCMIRSRDHPGDLFIHGLTEGGTAGSKKLMREVWRDGVWQEYCRVPLEIVFPLKDERLTKELGYSYADLATIGKFMVVYGGLRDIDLQAGETIVIFPATGGFGGAAVMVAVAMGAQVIAMGRNDTALAKLAKNFNTGRVKTAKYTGGIERDTQEIRRVAGEPVDAVFDIAPSGLGNPVYLKSLIGALKHNGRVSLMAGTREDIPIPYNTIMRLDLKLKGNWMYGRDGVLAIIKLVEAGLLKIGEPGGVRLIGDFGYKDWEKALDAADKNSGWDSSVVMRP